MNRARHIPWFNPREMDDATVLALNTGRAALLDELRQVIRQRSLHPGHSSHWLLTGPRGAGKSFFLRLLQASFNTQPMSGVRFVLLPEELHNVYAPHELLGEIERMLTPSEQGAMAMWRVQDAGQAWDQALQQLLGKFDESLLVVGIENMDEVLAQAFSDDVDNSRLRHLMSNEPRIMFVATAVQGEFDEQHTQRLFRQFEHRSLPRWNAKDHRTYLRLRARQQGGEPSAKQLNRIDAYSRYTGGNPRAAAVLAATILDVDDLMAGADDLDAAIEKMSDYYRALIERIPPNTRKLFDALIRGGEPASQTELATRTGARQSDISRAFAWLLDNGYVSESKEAGNKARQYRILDRLLVQFYRMRYLQPGQRSRLAVMADLLADMLSFSDKWQYASRYAEINHEAEAKTLVELALKERQIDINLLPEEMRDVRRLIAEQPLWEQHDARHNQQYPTLLAKIEALIDHFDDDSLRAAIAHLSKLARASQCGAVQGKELVDLVLGSLSLNPIEKYSILAFMPSADRNEFKWRDLIDVFQDEINEFKRHELSEAEAVAHLRTFKELTETVPLTATCHDFSSNIKQAKKYFCVPAHTAAKWATRAAMGWQRIGNQPLQKEALERFFTAVEEGTKNEFTPQQLLEALNQVEQFKPELTPTQYVYTLEARGELLTATGQPHSAFECHNQARDACLQSDESAIYDAKQRATWNLEKLAWNSGAMGDVIQAINLHQTVVTERISQNKHDWAQWSLGQIARHRLPQTDVATAWNELETALATLQVDGIEAIKQLGDAVADANTSKGESHSFAIGLEILQALAQRPQYPAEAVLRGLWIDMIEMNVPFSVLHDLLGEWSRLWPKPEHNGILALQQVLQEFLAYLQLPPEVREIKRTLDDPDLATTLKALEQALPLKTRHRLGLLADTQEDQTPV